MLKPLQTPPMGSVSPIATPTLRSRPNETDPFRIRETKPKQEGRRTPPRTKVICTIGPKTKTVESLSALMEAGMNVARLNFSHGDHEYHAGVIENVRAAVSKSKRLCAIMLDTKGPEIRTGKVKDGNVSLKKGQMFTLVTEDVLGDENQVMVHYKNLPKVLEKGNLVLIDDGLISMQVTSVESDKVICTVINSGDLGNTKGVNLPGVVVDLPAVTEKDINDLLFGVEQNVDMIAASFVRNADGVREIRRVLGSKGCDIKIISKIENQEGLDNFDEILEASDGIMVARGDLGVEIPLEQVALAQKMMIRKCNLAGKCVVTATQMLDSMISNPSPTRAEASDVANAVFDGSDCVMLSGETAKGEYPIEAVSIMAEICRETEMNIDYDSTFNEIRASLAFERYSVSIAEAIASSAVKTAYDLNASLLIVLTESGGTAKFVSKYRPRAPILCITANEKVARQLLTYRGVLPLLVGSTKGADSLIARAIKVAKELGMCDIGDIVVATTGSKEGVTGLTNNLKVLSVEF